MTLLAFQHGSLRRTVAAVLGLSASISALLPQMASARPWPIAQSSWDGGVQDYPAPPPSNPWWGRNSGPGYGSGSGYGSGYGGTDGYGRAASGGNPAYGAPPLTPEQQAQRCNTGRLIGGLGGGAMAYAMSRGDGRAWAIPLGALLGSQVGCSAAAGRGPLPW